MPLVDFNNAVEPTFEPVPKGTYDAQLDGWELKDGPKGAYYSLTYVLTDEAIPEGETKKVFQNSSVAPGALWRFKKDMLRLGANAQDMEPGSNVDTDEIVASVVGAPCRLRLDVVRYESNDTDDEGNKIWKERNEVKEVLSADLPF